MAIGNLFYQLIADDHSHSFWELGAYLGGPDAAIGNLFYWLMANSHPHSFWELGEFLGGPNVAIGNLFNQLMANSHSHSFWALEAVFPMVFFIPCPLAISFAHPFHTNRSASASLASSPHLASRLDLAWFMCIMVCFVPSPPTISFTHPNHPDRSQTVLYLHQVLTVHKQWTWLGWICPHLCLTPCSLTLPHPLCTVLFSIAHWV